MNSSKQRVLLKMMLSELSKSPQIYQPSDFWQKLNSKHLHQLEQDTLDNFKRTVNTKYFNWGILGILRHQLTPLTFALKQSNFSPFLKSSIGSKNQLVKSGRNLNWFSTTVYKVYIASFADYINVHDPLNLLKLLSEPLIGNPLIVKYKNMTLSQDLCNSIHEFYSITGKIRLRRNARIAELGAGYGRLAYVFLKTLPASHYVVIDIPPALFISQMYLSQVFTAEKIFTFRPYKKFAQIRNEYEKARIQFMLPHQLEMIPEKYFDLIINISSLHEMTLPQIKHYFFLIDRVGSGYFYTKQWRKSRVKDNQFITEKEYPIPAHWRTIFHRTHPVQSLFFEALYKIN